jgi:hypothetical protein
MRLKSWPQTIAGTLDWLRSNVLSPGPVGLAIAWMNLANLLAAPQAWGHTALRLGLSLPMLQRS